MKAAQSPPSPNWDWSDLQNENKYSEGSEPVSLVKGALFVHGGAKCKFICCPSGTFCMVVYANFDKYEFAIFHAT